jgi:pyruvate,water dikinase
VIFRSALLPITEPGVNPLVSLWRAKYDLSAIGRQIDRTSALSENSPRQTMEKLHKALEILCLLQIKNQWPYFFATLTTWILRWLAMNYRGLSHADFLNLLSKDAKNISIDIEHSIRSMARKIVQNKALADHFIKARAADLAEDMPPAVRTDFNNFIARYGCRSRHRTLLIKRWSESPEEIIGILQTLVRNQLKRVDGLSDSLLSAPLSGDASIKGFEDAEKPMKRCGKVARSSGSGLAFSRLSMHLIAQLNRRFLDLREELRFALDRILSMIRQTMLTLGKQTGLGDKVMFLNADELKAVVTGELSNRDARRRAFDRFNAFMQPFDAATFWNEGLAENEFQTGGRLIRGIGTSPGRVTGRAKIVDDPTRADIQKGDILIAKNTDPGWTPVLSIVGGVVTEEGGLLNHCAIVARELRVPSIVGVEGAARQIQDGDRITIDGGLGVIIIED